MSSLTNLPRVSIDDELTEARRELRFREQIYPDWIRQGKIKQETAAHRVACLRATIHRLEALLSQIRPQQQTLF